jgi:hypothetical protein
MKAITRAALWAIAATTLAGCASYGLMRLEPGKSSEADVRGALGEPAKVFSLPDGTRQLAFPTGPQGMQTYMAYVSPSGSLVRMEQVLADKYLGRIVRGSTTAAELERLIGPPWQKVAFTNKRQVAWDYVFQDTWGYIVDFSVMVNERDVVAETVYARRNPGDSSHD